MLIFFVIKRYVNLQLAREHGEKGEPKRSQASLNTHSLSPPPIWVLNCHQSLSLKLGLWAYQLAHVSTPPLPVCPPHDAGPSSTLVDSMLLEEALSG